VRVPRFRCGDSADPAYPALHGDLAGEIALFLSTGLDGFFTDFADIGAAAVRQSLGAPRA
jgi:glycerophosphoryl diester phosphodiesterase